MEEGRSHKRLRAHSPSSTSSPVNSPVTLPTASLCPCCVLCWCTFPQETPFLQVSAQCYHKALPMHLAKNNTPATIPSSRSHFTYYHCKYHQPVIYILLGYLALSPTIPPPPPKNLQAKLHGWFCRHSNIRWNE